MSREQQEDELIKALNKADKSSQSFFLYDLSRYGVGAGKIRDLVMRLSNDDFETFYNDEIFNLKNEVAGG